MPKIYHYLVEGECEKKFINIYKNSKYNKVLAGRVNIFNLVNNEMSEPYLAGINREAIVILIYDTDVNRTNILDKNIINLKRRGIKKILHVHSVKNFEDELIYSSDLKNIHNLFQTQGIGEFKKYFIKASPENIFSKLEKHNFDINKMWSRQGTDCFEKYDTKNGSKLIILKNNKK